VRRYPEPMTPSARTRSPWSRFLAGLVEIAPLTEIRLD
jgi:hypothetical protein